jgi:hypothetical protein
LLLLVTSCRTTYWLWANMLVYVHASHLCIATEATYCPAAADLFESILGVPSGPASGIYDFNILNLSTGVQGAVHVTCNMGGINGGTNAGLWGPTNFEMVYRYLIVIFLWRNDDTLATLIVLMQGKRREF